MSLRIPFDPSGLPGMTISAFDDLIATLQTWAGGIDGAGRWTDVPFAETIAKSDNGTWTITSRSQFVYRYAVLNDLMFVRITIRDSELSSGIGYGLSLRLPQGYRTSDLGGLGTCQWNSDAAVVSGVGVVNPGIPPDNVWLHLRTSDAASPTGWPYSVTDFGVKLALTIPIYRDGTI